MNGNMVNLANSRGCCAQSHKRCYKSNPSSIPEFQPRNGESRRFNDCLQPYLEAFVKKFLMIQPDSATNVTYCILAVEFYKYFLQME